MRKLSCKTPNIGIKIILDASNATILSLEYEYNIEFELSMTINKKVKLILG